MTFTVYTDGGCIGNKRDTGCTGAYAFVIIDSADCILDKGGYMVKNTTNNRMEMMAVIQGSLALKSFIDKYHEGSKNHNCIITTDSKYVSENYSSYLKEWKKSGWRKSSGGEVLNADLWKRIDELAPEFNSFRFQWVKGHNGNKINELVDGMVRKLMES